MAPASRLEHDGQIKHYSSLRLTLGHVLSSLTGAILAAHESLSRFAVAVDLEKYFEIYEVHHVEVEEAKSPSSVANCEDDTLQTLEKLRSSSRRFFDARRLLLCTLLAMNTECSDTGLVAWSSAAVTMQRLTALMEQVAADLRKARDDDLGIGTHSIPNFSEDTNIPSSTESAGNSNTLVSRH